MKHYIIALQDSVELWPFYFSKENTYFITIEFMASSFIFVLFFIYINFVYLIASLGFN